MTELNDADGSDLDDWVRRLTAELGAEIEVPLAQLLDIARRAAHEVTRPAAPITTFLLGYVAAQRGGGQDALDQVIAATQSVLDDFARPVTHRQDGFRRTGPRVRIVGWTPSPAMA